jgi:hypothetical protein
MLDKMVKRGRIAKDATRMQPKDQTSARPEKDKVMVFKDFFDVHLWFSLDPVVVEVFRLNNVYLHQLTPTS